MPKNNGKVAREERQKNAKLDHAERNKLGPAAQIEQLDHRLGAGVGAVRERARLARQLAKKAKQTNG